MSNTILDILTREEVHRDLLHQTLQQERVHSAENP